MDFQSDIKVIQILSLFFNLGECQWKSAWQAEYRLVYGLGSDVISIYQNEVFTIEAGDTLNVVSMRQERYMQG